MPGAVVDNGTGAVITFSSGFLGRILDISWSGIERESLETSHMGTAAPTAGKFGNRTFLPGDLTDPGECTIEIHYNAHDVIPPFTVAETVTVKAPLVAGDATAASWAGSGFLTSFEWGIPLEEIMTATATIKFSGEITRTAAA